MAISRASTSSIASGFAKYRKVWDQVSVVDNTLDVFGDGSCLALYTLNNSATDVSGNYNGTASNVTYTSFDKKLGSHAAVFNGSSSTISLPNIKNSYPFSVSMWATSNVGWQGSVGTFNELFNLSIAGQRVSLGQVNISGWPVGPCIMYGGTNHWSFNSSGVFNGDATSFYHIVFVIPGSNDSNHKIYVNGTSYALTNNGGGHGGTAGWNLGSNSSGAEFWPGKIDQVRFFNKSISQAEVTALYNNGLGK